MYTLSEKSIFAYSKKILETVKTETEYLQEIIKVAGIKFISKKGKKYTYRFVGTTVTANEDFLNIAKRVYNSLTK